MSSDKDSIIKDVDSIFGTQKPKSCDKRKVFIPLTILVILIGGGLAVYFVVYYEPGSKSKSTAPPVCLDPCVLTVVESIPENLTYVDGSPSHPSTYDGLMDLMRIATKSIEIASYYWTLNGSDISFHDQSSWQGESILKTLGEAGGKRKLKIRIAQNLPNGDNKNVDYLRKYAHAEVRTLNFSRLLGEGILHTKMWLIDRMHFYVGSANLDWRSLTQVKELGAVVYNCSCMASDMGKLFDTYWYLGAPEASVPSSWPSSYSTNINSNTSVQIKFNNTAATAYLSSSPPSFCASGRTIDVDAIVNIINDAKEFVYIAVMDYFPTTQFIKPRSYWPVIDDAIRRAAFDRGVNVSLLISYWKHTWDDMPKYLKSLSEMNYRSYYKNDISVKITVKMFDVPAFTEDQKKIPYSRVNHNKYMVTDRVAYIGTSNWSGDYFISTGGIGLIVNQTLTSPGKKSGMVRQQVEDIFLRDWYSNYSTLIWDFPFHHRFHEEL